MKRLLHIFLILALVTVSISPACKFISGKESLMEICGANGLLQYIPFPDGFNLPGKTKNEKHQAQEQCAFCFAQSHFKFTGAINLEILLFALLISTLVAAWITQRRRYHDPLPLGSRAPPVQ